MNTSAEKEETHVMDATPTWEANVSMCIEILQSSKPEAQHLARNELLRVGRLLDACMKKKQPPS